MPLPIPAGSYEIDAVHSQIGFAVTHLGISVVRGTLDSFGGTLTVGETLVDTTVEIEADMASVHSSNEGRNDVIRGENFFDTAQYPTMTFRSTAIAENGDGYQLTGDLTLRGITEPVTLDVSYNGSALFPIDGTTHFGFSATGEFSRSAYGVSFGVPMITDEVSLDLGVQFVQPAQEG